METSVLKTLYYEKKIRFFLNMYQANKFYIYKFKQEQENYCTLNRMYPYI